MLANVNVHLILLHYGYPSRSGAKKLQAWELQQALIQSGGDRCKWPYGDLLKKTCVMTPGEYETIYFQPVSGSVSPPAQIGARKPR